MTARTLATSAARLALVAAFAALGTAALPRQAAHAPVDITVAGCWGDPIQGGAFERVALGFNPGQQQLTDAYGQWKEASFEYVRQKPGTAIAIAAAAGFVLAKLLGGRNRDY